MKKGDCISNFEILDIIHMPELEAEGIWARHANGAELFHILNKDSENLFAFAFATPPNDAGGAAHILEHSVLCGSERYPLKDAFLVLAQGSLQTFLNAWTFPDKTVYPASSVNEKDYFNLMSVYGDAVFRPLLSEWTFMQEGWRIERGRHGPEYTGVVYNEMKGAYSSMDSYAGLWSVKAVMPDTPYALESGGDPGCIPDLSWEALKEFHRTRYSPGNCKIFLAGNIPAEQQMERLDQICRGLPPGKALPVTARTKPWSEARCVRVPCPGNGGSKPQAFVSWLCSDTADTAETMALSCLTEILLGHDGSPLAKALIESGLGEDLSPSSGLEAELRETVFCAGLRGVKTERKGNVWDDSVYRCVEDLILGELGRLVQEGIPQKEIDAALLATEFSRREIRRSHGPYSLVWLRRSLRGWLNGAKPWEAVLFTENFAELKRRIRENPFIPGKRGGYFEMLIEKYFLSNPHRALVAVEPEADYLEKKENERAASLAKKEQGMTAAEKKALRKKSRMFEKIQNEGDSPEALASIPHLSRNDLIPKLENIPREFAALNGSATPAMLHPVFTNGISYADMAFPVDILEPEDYLWLPFFSRAVVSMGMEGMDYAGVSSLLAETTGGFYAMLETGTPAFSGSPDSAAFLGRDWIIYRIKALDEKLADSLDLAVRLISGADFSDLRRLRDLVVEMKNDNDSSLAPAGSSYAASRSGMVTRSRAADEIWNGLVQIFFSHDLAEMDTAEISRKLSSIRDTLCSRSGLMMHLCAGDQAMPGAVKAASLFSRFGPPSPPNPRCRELRPFLALRGAPAKGTGAPEIWASPSLQIGFAAMSFPAAPYGSREHAAELVFSHELSTGALWESIRMKGGAYGAHARPDSLEGVFSFTTYRDPNPLRSLKLFPEMLLRSGRHSLNDDSLEKAVIGTFSRDTAPHTPSDNSFGDFLRYLYGVTAENKYRRLKETLDLTAEELAAAARHLAGSAPGFAGRPVIIAGTKTAEKAAAALGVTVQTLPV